jgi:excisionase family DNA binding protein
VTVADDAGQKRPRFLTIEQVAEELAVGAPTVRQLLKAGDLRGLQIGGRGIWRIAAKDLEEYIQQAYKMTAERIADGAFAADEADLEAPDNG